MQTGRRSSAGSGGEGCPCIPWLGTGKKPCCGVPHPGSEPPGAAGAPPSPPHPAAGVTALSHVPRGFIQANLQNGALPGQSTSRHTEPASCSCGDGSSSTTDASVSREHPLGTFLGHFWAHTQQGSPGALPAGHSPRTELCPKSTQHGRSQRRTCREQSRQDPPLTLLKRQENVSGLSFFCLPLRGAAGRCLALHGHHPLPQRCHRQQQERVPGFLPTHSHPLQEAAHEDGSTQVPTGPACLLLLPKDVSCDSEGSWQGTCSSQRLGCSWSRGFAITDSLAWEPGAAPTSRRSTSTAGTGCVFR